MEKELERDRRVYSMNTDLSQVIVQNSRLCDLHCWTIGEH